MPLSHEIRETAAASSIQFFILIFEPPLHRAFMQNLHFDDEVETTVNQFIAFEFLCAPIKIKYRCHTIADGYFVYILLDEL